MIHERKGGKRVKVQAFGQYLSRSRGQSRKTPPSVEAIARDLRELHQIKVDDATLRGYEYGWVDKPDPVVLMGLAQLYRTDIERFIAVLAANRNNPHLTEIELERVLRDVDATSRGETGAAARLQEIQERIEEIASELFTLSERDKSREPPTAAGEAASTSD